MFAGFAHPLRNEVGRPVGTLYDSEYKHQSYQHLLCRESRDISLIMLANL